MNEGRPDEDWFRRFVEGESTLMEQVYRSNFDAVRRSAGQVVADGADRDAIVQQVFADLLDSRRLRTSYRGNGLTNWLGAIARHQALNFVRRQRRVTSLDEAPEPRAPSDPMAEFRQDLQRFCQTIDPSRQMLVRYRFLEGMTQEEAAERLAMPRSTLEDQEGQLKKLLRAFLLDDKPPVRKEQNRA